MANLGNTIINGILRVNGKLNVGDSITASSFIGDLTGNAETANKANQLTTARTVSLTGDATASGSFNGTANLSLSTTVKQMDMVEDRDVKPSVTPKGKFSTYFATKAGLTGTADSDYQDLLVMNGWGDTAGGNVNALSFDKSTKAIFHYQAAQGATTWGTASQIAYITSNVASATKLKTARNINGVAFDGTKDITIQDNTKLPLAGGTLTGTLKVQTADAQGQILLGDNMGVGVRLIAGAQPASAYSRFAITKDHIYSSGLNLYDNAWVVFNGDGDIITFDGTIIPKQTSNSIGDNDHKWENIYAKNFTGALNGNAKTASTLATARTITLSGDVTGSASFDGSRNIIINTTNNLDSGVIIIIKTLTVTTEWQDTGIEMNDLDGSGSYIVQVSGMSSSATSFWSEIWTGVMSVFSGTTNSTDSDEIVLHKNGHASNGNTIYLRTIRQSGTSVYSKLQISAKTAFSASSNITFKFKKLI